MILNKYAADIFLYGYFRPFERIKLTNLENETYKLFKTRLSGGMSNREAIKQVSKLMGITPGNSRQRFEKLQDKGWL